jgi:hypothetical protein
MRIRSIKPEFWTDAKVSSLGYLARLLFIGLWNHADDEGRFKSDPRILKGFLFPVDDKTTVKDIAGALSELSVSTLVLLTEIDGEKYGCCPNFKKHQKINRPTPSKLPEVTESSVSTHGVISDRSLTEREREVEREGEMERDFKPRAKLAAAANIEFDLDSFEFTGITEKDRIAWANAYPACDVQSQLLRMVEWLKANPKKAHKSNWRRFICNWLSKCQDRGGGLKSNGQRADSISRVEAPEGKYDNVGIRLTNFVAKPRTEQGARSVVAEG